MGRGEVWRVGEKCGGRGEERTRGGVKHLEIMIYTSILCSGQNSLKYNR